MADEIVKVTNEKVREELQKQHQRLLDDVAAAEAKRKDVLRFVQGHAGKPIIDLYRKEVVEMVESLVHCKKSEVETIQAGIIARRGIIEELTKSYEEDVIAAKRQLSDFMEEVRRDNVKNELLEITAPPENAGIPLSEAINQQEDQDDNLDDEEPQHADPEVQPKRKRA